MAHYSKKEEWNTQDYAAARRDFCKKHGMSKGDFKKAPGYLLDEHGGAGGREKQYVETDGNITMGWKLPVAAIGGCTLAYFGLLIPAVIFVTVMIFCVN